LRGIDSVTADLEGKSPMRNRFGREELVSRNYTVETIRENAIALTIVATTWVLFAGLITGEMF
jgi:hypothetical protein